MTKSIRTVGITDFVIRQRMEGKTLENIRVLVDRRFGVKVSIYTIGYWLKDVEWRKQREAHLKKLQKDNEYMAQFWDDGSTKELEE